MYQEKSQETSQEKYCFEKWFTMEPKHFKDTSAESTEQVGNKQKAKQIRVRLVVHKPACNNLFVY